MSDELLLRPATADDLPVLREFEQGVVQAERPLSLNLKPDPIRYYNLEHMLESGRYLLLVGEVDGAPVACGYARLDESAAHYVHGLNVYLGFMFVLPGFRGRGYNSRVMEALQRWGKEQGAGEARLDVYHLNESAIRSYEKAGFVSVLREMRKSL
jgi:ribosomal protein S18 acetylase RimI-like enzyme